MPTLGSAPSITPSRGLQLPGGTTTLSGAITPAEILGLMNSSDFASNPTLNVGAGAGLVRSVAGGLAVSEGISVGPTGLIPSTSGANGDLVLSVKGTGIIRAGLGGPRVATVNDLGSVSAGGTTGDLQVNNGGVLVGIDMTGDVTLDTATGIATLANKNSAFGPIIADAGGKIPLPFLPSSRLVIINGSTVPGTLATPYQIGDLEFRVFVNKPTGSATYVKLPLTPVVGEIYWIVDEKGDWDTNALHLDAGITTIQGVGNITLNDKYGTIGALPCPSGVWRLT